MSASNIPQQLRDLPNWVVWKKEKRNGKFTKVPYDTKGGFAKSNDAATWCSFESAEKAVDPFTGGDKFDGVGFMLHGTPFVGIDFDGCIDDGVPEPYVLNIISQLGNPYVEVTPSGTGLRVFVECPKLPPGTRKVAAKKKGSEKYGAEIYSGAEAGRYLTLTGDRLQGDGIPKIDNLEIPYYLITRFSDDHFKKLWMGDATEYENDDSRVDLALLGCLARSFGADRDKMTRFFNASVPGHREKWVKREDYRERTITKALIGVEPTAKTETTVFDDADESQSQSDVPVYPVGTIDGDSIGELTCALTEGTFIPPQFMRENIKVALGSIVDGYVGFPNHGDLHMRHFLHNVSVSPQSGKGESYKRSIEQGTGFLSAPLRKFGVCTIKGSLFGSGEYMIKVLAKSPTHRGIARFDEMSEIWAKSRANGSTLEQKFLELYESTSAAQGSFKNGTHEVDDFHLSVVGDFTRDSFERSFAGSGSNGSGYLSRCIFQFSDRLPVGGDWSSIDMEKVNRIVSTIEKRVEEILEREERFIPIEEPDAKALRWEFFAWVDTQDRRFTARLKDHVTRDVLFRALFSGDGQRITREMMARSISWGRNQLENRLALFPEDAGSATEIMEHKILRVIKDRGQVSERDLKRHCHLDRAGSGGREVFNRALRSLMLAHEVRILGKTKKGFSVYGSFTEGGIANAA